MFGLMIVGTLLSSVLSNTDTAACLLPVALGICSSAKIPASRQLMPLAFACGWGGIITMVGTPPNTLVLGPGDYKFMDYVKSGCGLVFVCRERNFRVSFSVFFFQIPQPFNNIHNCTAITLFRIDNAVFITIAVCNSSTLFI